MTEWLRFVVGVFVGFLPVGRVGGDVGMDVMRRLVGRRVVANGMITTNAHGDEGLGG